MPVICPELEMILQKLYTHRYIYGYLVDFERNKTTIYLGTADTLDTCLITDIRLNFRKCISLAKIKKFVKKFPYILGFVYTSNGILTFAECINFKCGGKVLAIIL
jgi:ribosomal protein S8